ncbi:MAG: S41 family peptidase [Acidobacteriota bacterium]|nr:S41 family peptidase [Acidobacteriota bacterium]
MSKRRLASWITAICIVAVAGVASYPADSTEATLTAEQRALNVESFDYVWTTIRDKHYDAGLLGLDWDAVRTELRPKVEAASSMNEARSVMDEMIERLGQSHFNVIPDEVYEAIGEPEGALGGVTGIDVRVLGGHALVTRVEAGSPAAEAGVRPGWEIVRIAADDVSELLEKITAEFDGKSWKAGVLSGAVGARLRGAVGEEVAVTLLDPDDTEIEMKISLIEERGKKSQFGHLPPQHVWAESSTVDGNIGYITFNMWLDPLTVMPVVNDAMASFIQAGVEGVIIDIRGNGGGLPGMAMGVAGWLVGEKNKYLGTMKTRDTELKIIVNPRPNAFGGPVAVLIDELSASCSEIFSGGMQDIGRAQVVGRPSRGAAHPAVVEKLPNGDGFQYAFANYTSADGEVLEGVGVIPDIQVVPTREALLAGRDPVLEAAVAWIQNQ